MKNFTLLVLLLGVIQIVNSQQLISVNDVSSIDLKSRFDLQQDIELLSLKSAVMGAERVAMQSVVWQYTMMEGGFFTLGLNKGVDESMVDNNCPISFGHPFSMASFPSIVLDGEKFDPLSFMFNGLSEPGRVQDTLYHEFTLKNNVKSLFRMFLGKNQKLRLEYIVYNNDEKIHEVSVGLLLDVAIGKWGDGFVEIDHEKQIFPKATIQDCDSISIYERNTKSYGVGALLEAGEEKPDNVKLDNWINLYNDDNGSMDLYDVGLLYEWKKKNIEPGEKFVCSIDVSELFNKEDHPMFMRWNLPNALSIENNILFPMELTTVIETFLESGGDEYQLKVSGSPYVKGSIKNGMVSPGNDSSVFNTMGVEFLENYDSVVVPITLSLLQQGQIVDEITRNVFIPASPYSDEGLQVTIDSLYTKDDKIIIRFTVFDENTQQILYQINKNNAFFRVNGSRIDDFTLEKDTSGGINEVDIVFIMDVTGSMSNEIASVRDNIIEFADSLQRKGYNYQLGMVTFLDVIENVYPFTNKAAEFKTIVSQQNAHGGGDYAENSLDALKKGTEYQFRPTAKRIFIWITDASFHEKDNVSQLTKQDVVDALLAKGIQTHCIGNPIEQLNYYDQITLNTGGNFYDINGNFRDILLDVSRFGQSPSFNIVLNSNQVQVNDEIEVEVHYAGLGGSDTIIFKENEKKSFEIDKVLLNIYPMPISEKSLLKINNPDTYSLSIKLINLLGQVKFQKDIRNVSGPGMISMSELYSSLKESHQPSFIKIDVFDMNQKWLETKTIKVIR